nr:immunoglobulin heavy chain junction region [Mus musculus]
LLCKSLLWSLLLCYGL